MTLRELKNELLSLTSLPSSEIDKRVCHAASRALFRIHTELKAVTEKSIYVTRPHIASHTPQLLCCGGERLELKLSGKAFSMRLCGKGSYTIYDGGESYTESFNLSGESRCGFLKTDEAKIVLSCESAVTVMDLVCYSEVRGDGEKIPAYDELYREAVDTEDRFIALAEPICDGCGRKITGAECIGGVIYYPKEFEGEIKVRYRRLPGRISGAYPDEAIDLPTSYAPLLPILTAAELLLEDDPERAMVLYNTYTGLKDALLSCRPYGMTAKYNDTTRWA
ncbi:MAG: hypothetical protein IJX92_04410 [Clostridia bacterium]|nr:hypothetical protein [Clostridia bacterium]